MLTFYFVAGCYIKLRDEASKNRDLQQLLQTIISPRIMKGFLVDNDSDSRHLDELMKKCYYGRDRRDRQPTIFITSLGHGRYDTRHKGAVSTTPNAKVMLEYLDIENPDVFNLIVDRVRADTTLVCDQNTAQRLFSSRHTVPRNAVCAVTPDFYR